MTSSLARGFTTNPRTIRSCPGGIYGKTLNPQTISTRKMTWRIWQAGCTTSSKTISPRLPHKIRVARLERRRCMVSNLYPLKFKSIFKKTPWGGSRLGSFFGKDVPADGGIGESWEITDRDGDNSIIANGVYKDMRLRQLLDGPRINDVLGYEYKRERSENRFPILIKLIDTADRLSIQVHPDDAYVRAHDVPGESGKMEAWYIIHTEPGAWIIRGLRPGMTRKHLESSLGNGNLENCLNLLSVRPGDVIFIPPGIVHTIGPGITLLE